MEHLRDATARDREAELWVATPDDSEEIVGTVTIMPGGSPWREMAPRRRGRVPDARRRADRARHRASARPWSTSSSTGSVASGASAVVMSTLPRDAAAHRIYERVGFVREPSRDWSPLPGVDLVAYRLDLGPA